MNRFRMGNVDCVLVAAALAALCALGCGGPDSRSIVLEDVETGQSRVVVCNEYQTFEDREMYVVSAMNRKLYHFPDFAAALGMNSVSDCDGARAFVRGYVGYRDTHPGFDANEPRPPIPAIPDDPDLRSAKVTDTVTKLGNGSRPGDGFKYPNESVVFIFSDPDAQMHIKGCSGTFIAKNFILTAAHCMQVLKDKNGHDTLDGNATWTIQWSDVDGNQVHQLKPGKNTVKQLSDPLYVAANHVPDEDLALLYLDKHVYDLFLPPVTQNGAAMRLSLSPPKQGDVSHVAGWGQAVPVFASDYQLATAPAGTFVTSSLTPLAFSYERSVASDGSICTGDSGGALYRDQVLSPTQTVPVLVGVTSKIDPGGNCALVDQEAHFARIDSEVQAFIEPRMSLIYGTGTAFQCRPFLTGTANAYVECWGVPCDQSSKCTSNPDMADFFCSRNATTLNVEYGKCPVCSYPEVGTDTSCGCMSGQCLPLPAIFNGF